MSNMVTNIIRKGLPFLAALFVCAACNKPFTLDLSLAVDSHEYTLTSKAGTARIFFYTTRPWTLTLNPSDCAWASVNRTSGDGKDDVEEILFTYEENNDPDRQVDLVITAGDLQQVITMSQTGTARDRWEGSVSIDDLNPVYPNHQ